MRPEFVRAVDPVFLAALSFLSRIEKSERIVPADERHVLLKKIDEAESILGDTEEWKLSKYALCAWIDSQLISAPWVGNGWWKENLLERRYFNTRDAHTVFFHKAAEAAILPRKDALEVFYLAVVLGFRGMYGDPDFANQANARNMPSTVEEWCKRVARSLQLRQGRPAIDESVQPGGNAQPLSGRTVLISMSVFSALAIAVAIGVYLLLFVGFPKDKSSSSDQASAKVMMPQSVIQTAQLADAPAASKKE